MYTLISLLIVGGSIKAALWAIDQGNITGKRLKQQAEWVETLLLNRRRRTQIRRWRGQW